MKSYMPKMLGLAIALGFSGAVHAVALSGGLVDGFNTIEDQDREAYIDANNDGIFNIGDVFIGFVRFDDFLPAGLDSNNQVYGIISNQVVGGSGTNIVLGATTVAGLTLADLTGDANVGANDMFAVYDRSTPYSSNLITHASDVGSDIFDVIDFITGNGTLRLTAGLYASDNWFVVNNGISGLGLGVPTATFAGLAFSITVGAFTGGVDVNYNNTNYIFNDTVQGINPLLPVPALVTTQIGIGNGAIRGATGDGQEGVFGNALSDGTNNYTQCLTSPTNNVACGFVTDADYFVNVTRVPEPGTLALLGAALLGLGFIRRTKV